MNAEGNGARARRRPAPPVRAGMAGGILFGHAIEALIAAALELPTPGFMVAMPAVAFIVGELIVKSKENTE